MQVLPIIHNYVNLGRTVSITSFLRRSKTSIIIIHRWDQQTICYLLYAYLQIQQPLRFSISQVNIPTKIDKEEINILPNFTSFTSLIQIFFLELSLSELILTTIIGAR